MVRKKDKRMRKNPFVNAEDMYITPHKIAVVNTTNVSTKREHVKTEKTKYYTKNAQNISQLKKVTGSIRVGRKGNTYEKL